MDRRSRPTLLIASAGTLLVYVNYTLPIVMLGVLGHDLHATPSDLTWVLSAAALGTAAGVLPAGSLADQFGRKRLFLIGLVLLAAGSVVGALATSAPLFIATRGVMSVASAPLLSSSLALLAQEFEEGPPRAFATGVWGSMIGAGIAVGPLIGALLGQAGSWRAGYWALAAATLLLAIWGARGLRESRAAQARPLDVRGLLTLSGGLLGLVAALVRGNTDGWSSPRIVLLLAAGTGLLIAFVIVERRQATPMFELALLRRPTFAAAVVGSLCVGGSVIALMNYLPAYLEQGPGSSTVATALELLPWSGVSFLIALRAREVARLLDPRTQLASGFLLCAGGAVTMLGLSGGSSWRHLLPGLLLAGVGSGLLNSALARITVAALPRHHSGMAAGATNAARFVGNAVGVAAMVALAQAAVTANARRALSSSLHLHDHLLVKLISDGRLTQAAARAPHTAPAAMHAVSAQAHADAMNTVVVVAAVVAVLGALAAGLVRRQAFAPEPDGQMESSLCWEAAG
jgi:MFS family permease